MSDKPQLDPRITRFATGVTLTALVAFCTNGTLAYLAPVLAVNFLSQPFERFSPALAIKLAGIICGSLLVGVVFTNMFYSFPLVFIPALGLVLFCLFYAHNRGISQVFTILGLISFTILPLIQSKSNTLHQTVAFHLAINAGLALLVSFVVWNLFPQSPQAKAKQKTPPPHTIYGSPQLLAVRSTAVLLPMTIFFISMQWTAESLILINVAMLCLIPEVSGRKTAVASMLLSTLIGGLAATLFYYLMITAPVLPFLAALLLLASLMFGASIFSKWKYAGFMPSATVCFFVLIGGSMKLDADFENAFIRRLILILCATLYTVFIQFILQHFLSSTTSKSS